MCILFILCNQNFRVMALLILTSICLIIAQILQPTEFRKAMVTIILCSLISGSQCQKSMMDVTESLLTSSGYHTHNKPRLKLINSTSSVAYYSQLNNTIYVESKLLKICRSFEKDSIDAVAIVLGHELAHWINHQSSGFVSNSNSNVFSESEADIQGLFLCYQAGYKNSHLVTQLLDRIYKEYNIENCVAAYPSLSNRQNYNPNLFNKIEQLQLNFEAATNLILLAEYDVAIHLLENMSRTYAGFEIKYNLALAQTLKALNLGSSNPYNMVLPIEPDYKLRIRKPTTLRGEEDIEPSRIIYLKNALGLLDRINHDIYPNARLLRLYVKLILNENTGLDEYPHKNMSIEDFQLFLAIKEKTTYNNNFQLQEFVKKTKNKYLKSIAKANLNLDITHNSHEKLNDCTVFNDAIVKKLATENISNNKNLTIFITSTKVDNQKKLNIWLDGNLRFVVLSMDHQKWKEPKSRRCNNYYYYTGFYKSLYARIY